MIAQHIFTSARTPDRDDFSGTAGYIFTLESDITVVALGRIESVGGTLTNHRIGVWDSNSQSQIAFTTITPTSQLNNGWRYESVTPFALSSGVTYRIGSEEFVGVDNWVTRASVSGFLSGSAVIGGGCFTQGNFNFPGLAAGGVGFALAWPEIYTSGTVTPSPRRRRQLQQSGGAL